MLECQIAPGAADQTIMIFVPDAGSSVGAGLTGLVYNSAGLVCYYARTATAVAALTLATQTVTGAHADGGFVEISSTNLPGWYRLDLSDAVVAVGAADVVIGLKGAASMVPVEVHVSLAPYVLTTGYVAGDVKAINASVASAVRLALATGQMIPGTVNDANTAPTTTVFAAADITEATADHFVGRMILWMTGALAGQSAWVSAYALVTGEGRFTTVDAMTEAPADGDTFLVI